MVTVTEIAKHLEVINGELADVKTEMRGLATDVAWLKSKTTDLDNRLWWVVGGVAVSIGVGILGILLK